MTPRKKSRPQGPGGPGADPPQPFRTGRDELTGDGATRADMTISTGSAPPSGRCPVVAATNPGADLRVTSASAIAVRRFPIRGGTAPKPWWSGSPRAGREGESTVMSDTSRRKFLAAAGAGTAAGAVVSLSGGAAEAVDQAAAATPPRSPVVAYVQDPQVGVLHLMVGEREVIVEDHDLVARILNAAASTGRPVTCPHTARHPRSARTRSPTAPTSTPSSARTGPTRSR